MTDLTSPVAESVAGASDARAPLTLQILGDGGAACVGDVCEVPAAS